MSIKRKTYEELYKELKNYRLVGERLGVTRQAVEISLKRSRDPEVRAIIKSKRVDPNGSCSVCGKSFRDPKVQGTSFGLCSLCRDHQKHPEKKRRRKHADFCLDCKKPTPMGTKRTKDRCRECYAKHRRHTIPEVAERVRQQNIESYYRHHEKNKQDNREYYYRNRERLLAYHKAHWPAYKKKYADKIKERSKKYNKLAYERKKALAEKRKADSQPPATLPSNLRPVIREEVEKNSSNDKYPS